MAATTERDIERLAIRLGEFTIAMGRTTREIMATVELLRKNLAAFEVASAGYEAACAELAGHVVAMEKFANPYLEIAKALDAEARLVGAPGREKTERSG